MARIQRFTSRVQADLACSMLTSSGVDARVSSDDAGGLHPDIAYGIGGTVIVVPDDQLEWANSLLDEHESATHGSGDGERMLSRRSGSTRSMALRVGTAIVVAAFLFMAATGIVGFYRF